MFVPLNFATLTARMKALLAGTRLTDFHVGSLTRTLLETSAIVTEQLYADMYAGLVAAVPESAYVSFGFGRLPAASAGGVLTLTNAAAPGSNIAITTGAVFTTASGLVFKPMSGATWLAGQHSVTVTVYAVVAGAGGNILPNAITGGAGFTLPDGTTFANPPFITGRDIESDAERAYRFQQFLIALARGTIDALRYAAGRVTRVDGAGQVIEYVTYIGVAERPGLCSLGVRSNAGTPTDDLLAAIASIIEGTNDTPGYRAAGVEVLVAAAPTQHITLAITVDVFPEAWPVTTGLSSSVQAAVFRAAGAVPPGGRLYAEDIQQAVLAVTGVRAVRIHNPENLEVAAPLILVLDSVTPTWNLPDA